MEDIIQVDFDKVLEEICDLVVWLLTVYTIVS